MQQTRYVELVERLGVSEVGAVSAVPQIALVAMPHSSTLMLSKRPCTACTKRKK